MKKLSKLLGLAMSALMMIGAAVGVRPLVRANAEEATITFKTATTDGSTSITDSTKVSDVVVEESVKYIDSFTSNCSKSYYCGVNGVKIGSSKDKGVFEFKLSEDYRTNIISISFASAKYGSDSGTLSLDIDGVNVAQGISPNNGFKKDFTTATEMTTLKFYTSAKRAYLSSITLEYAEDDSSKVLVEEVALNPSILEMYPEEKKLISATISPSTATRKALTWTSNNEEVATVDSKGEVTAIKTGTAEIKATAIDGSNVYGTCSLTVKEAITYDEVLVLKNHADFSDSAKWSTTYNRRTMTFSNIGSLVFDNANKPNSSDPVNDCPVTKGSNITFTMEGRKTVSSLKAVFKQWSTKTQTVNLKASYDKGQTFGSVISTTEEFLILNFELNNASAFRFEFGNNANQIGLYSISFNYGEDSNYASINLKNKFPKYGVVGEEISFTPDIEGANLNDIVYTFNDENKAYVDDGKLCIVESGLISITASITVGDKTYSSTESIMAYDVSSVNDAVDVFNSMDLGAKSEEKYVVEGYVTNLTSTNYGNFDLLSFDLTSSIYIRGTYLRDSTTKYSNFPAAQKFQVGDKVTIYGQLYKYNSSGNALLEIENAELVSNETFYPEDLLESQNTRSALSYNYSANNDHGYDYSVKKSDGTDYDFEAVAIRFGGLVDYNLWNFIDDVYGITDYGIDYYYQDLDNNYQSKYINWNVSTDGIFRSDDGITVDENGSNVLFNGRLVVPFAKWNIGFAAKAYVKVEDGSKIYLGVTETTSVASLAEKYYDNRVSLGLSDTEIDTLEWIMLRASELE